MRLRRRRHQLPVEPLPDGLPKRGLFSEPIRVTTLTSLEPESIGADWRVTFMVEVRDDAGQRCPDVAIEARLTGPDRSAVAIGNTDMFGRVRFRTTGPPGGYQLELTDVGAGGLNWDRDGGPTTSTVAIAEGSACS